MKMMEMKRRIIYFRIGKRGKQIVMHATSENALSNINIYQSSPF